MKEPLLGISTAQVVGGAAAAATAAALGSRLGVVGTVVGAALLSVISAVAGAFYTQSLKRTRAAVARTAERLPTVTLRVPAQGSDIEVAGTLPDVPDQPEGTEADVAEVEVEAPSAADPTVGDDATRPVWWRRLTWKSVAVTSIVTFVLAAVVVTGFELVADRSLDGTGRTSVGHLLGDDSKTTGSDDQTETPSPSPSTDSTQQPTGDSTTSATPTPSPSESATPSEDPSSTPEPSSTAEPSGSATAVPTTD